MKFRHLAGSALLAAILSTSAFAQSDNTNSKVAPSFTEWMGQQSTTNQNRISRQSYMDEVGRRWDQSDKDRKGLSVDQINGAYGYNSAAPTMNKDTTPPANQSGPGAIKK